MVQRMWIKSALVLTLCLTSFACSEDDSDDDDGDMDQAGEMASDGDGDDDDGDDEDGDDEDADDDSDDGDDEDADDDSDDGDDEDADDEDADDDSDDGDDEDADGTDDMDESDVDAGIPGADMAEIDEDGTDPLSPIDETVALPIVFVHGFVGSAQQFSSQAIRYVANGYPADRLFAYDHDGIGMDIMGFVTGLDAMIDEAREKFDVEQVYLMGHSRGTFVSSTYLSDAERAEKVAKYVSLDGRGCGMIPMSVPCISPSQEGRMGTHELPGQKHVEVATSKESFAAQWEFFFGEPPGVVDIVKQRQPVQISGRAVNFPANTGRDGTTLSIWEVEKDTGLRVADEPLAEFEIDESGDWGPAIVDPDNYYELVLGAEGEDRYHHFYPQRFLRSDQFVRLLSGPSDSDVRVNTNAGDGHSALTVIRMREWTQSDVLEVSTKTEEVEEDAGNVVTADLGEGGISIFIHDDAATPGETTLAPLPWFNDQPFQTGVDVYLPAADPPNGTITLTNLPRGDADQPQTLNVPNWPSTNHAVTVQFSDFPLPQE